MYVTIDLFNLQFNVYAPRMEFLDIVLTVLISFICYIPVRVTNSVRFCAPFVLVSLGKDQDVLATAALATAATIILSILLLVLMMGLLVIGYETKILKKEPLTLPWMVEMNSQEVYTQAQQKRSPDRKLIYYGLGVFLQYVSPNC